MHVIASMLLLAASAALARAAKHSKNPDDILSVDVVAVSTWAWTNSFTSGNDLHVSWLLPPGDFASGGVTLNKLAVNQGTTSASCPSGGNPRVEITDAYTIGDVDLTTLCDSQDSCGSFTDCDLDNDDFPIAIVTEPFDYSSPLEYQLIATSGTGFSPVSAMDPERERNMTERLHRLMKRGPRSKHGKLRAAPFDNMFFMWQTMFTDTITDMTPISVAVPTHTTLDTHWQIACYTAVPNFPINITLASASGCASGVTATSTSPSSAPVLDLEAVNVADTTMYVCAKPSGFGFQSSGSPGTPLDDTSVTCRIAWRPAD